MGELRWNTAQSVHRLIGVFVTIKGDEVPAVLCSFFTLFSILASYFLLLPLREDAGISLGTSTLPLLFMCSLVITLLFTPAASAFLSRSHPRSRETALKQFYCFMAFILLVFYFLYNHSAAGQLLERAAAYAEHPRHWQQHAAEQAVNAQQPSMQQQVQEGHRHISSWPGALGAPLVSTVATANAETFEATGILGTDKSKQQQQQSAHTSSLAQTPAAGSAPAVDAVAFSGRRLQHAENDMISSASSGEVRTDSKTGSTSTGSGTDPASSSSSSSITGSRHSSPRQNVSSQYGDSTLSGSQRSLRAAFYVWVNVMNLVGISSLWARCADAFSPEAGARLFGFISAGATLGQLAGSLLALMVTWAAEAVAAQQLLGRQAGAGAVGSSSGPDSSNTGSTKGGAVTDSAPAAGLILVAALLQLVAAQLVCRVRPLSSSSNTAGAAVEAIGMNGVKAGAAHPEAGTQIPASCDREDHHQQQHADFAAYSSSSITAVRRPSGVGRSSLPGGLTSTTVNSVSAQGSINNGDSAGSLRRRAGVKLHSMLSGFRLVLSSRYLLMLCGNLLLTYVVGSLMYFQRALVVSTSVRGPSYRTAFFATLNTWSAAGILLMQLCATSSMLRYLGMPAALGLGPAICLLGTLAVTLLPCPAMVAAFEVIRKLVGYAVHRPAREVLFTVVSRDEKYRAKLVIDTVVQRLGDAIAAAAFQVLDVTLHLGQAGVGAAGCMMCLVWLLMAQRLGRQHEQLAVQAQVAAAARDKSDHQV